ncbi:SDR family NAD(P)-dependent oxidoreductase [Caldifermentibacillus hisashii]|uniref:SDR family NAD(P)-dependent oxidoreductase n=1 Tax=Caldifermentibacillus hisashii TaxID=996558 RepID=UPI003BEF1E3C
MLGGIFMKRALVLGASGGMGYSIVNELTDRGIEVIAFARTKKKLEKLFSAKQNVTIFTGDIFKLEDLMEAAANVDIIFQAANIPYPEWEEKLANFIGQVVQVTETKNIKLALVDNIYAYGKNPGIKVNEQTPKNPHTKKGNIRLQVANMVMQANNKSFIAHFPDFYGPNAENTLLHYTLQRALANKPSIYIGNQKIAREFIFTPDGAKALVELALNETSYGEEWNIPGHSVITGEEIIKIIRELTGYNKKVFTVTKSMIQMLGLFNPMMREVVELFYLNEDPVMLSGEKFERRIGPLPRTSYYDGLKQTIDYMRGTVKV